MLSRAQVELAKRNHVYQKTIKTLLAKVRQESKTTETHGAELQDALDQNQVGGQNQSTSSLASLASARIATSRMLNFLPASNILAVLSRLYHCKRHSCNQSPQAFPESGTPHVSRVHSELVSALTRFGRRTLPLRPSGCTVLLQCYPPLLLSRTPHPRALSPWFSHS